MWKKNGIMLVLAAGCCLAAAFGASPVEDNAEIYNTSVLLEAHVVQVTNRALEEAGIDLLAKPGKESPLLNILWNLRDNDKARVIAGVKTVCAHDQESVARQTRRFLLEQTTDEGTFADWYEVGKTLAVHLWLKPEGRIWLEYNYEQSDAEPSDDKKQAPAISHYEWQGSVMLQAGKPVIAGALQNREVTVVLIITATVQDDKNSPAA